MKAKFIQLLAILACMLSLAALGHAQINKNSEFAIPFEFVVADKVLPAGEYSLRSANDQNTTWILAGKAVKSKTVFLLASTVEDLQRKKEAGISFRQYGDRYFLAQFSVSAARVTLFKSEEERALEREFSANNKSVKTEIVATRAQ